MLTGVHFLLTYACNAQCDHCFLYCGPRSKGTMTRQQVMTLLEECTRLGAIADVCFEGGEPFLFYPLMLEGIKEARRRGFSAGIVTNAYWATCFEDARLWLEPLAQAGVSNIGVSDDELHFGACAANPAKHALAAAKTLGIAAYALCKESPRLKRPAEDAQEKGTPEISGGIKFRGRAVEKLVAGLPLRRSGELIKCPYEDLANPKRVHVDAFGNVHLCQGISMGNCWQTPFSELVRKYDASLHPICGPLVRGGPQRLREELGLAMHDAYVDECHMCYEARRALVDAFPELLGPRQVYGLGIEPRAVPDRPAPGVWALRAQADAVK